MYHIVKDMTEEKKLILNKIDILLNKRSEELLNKLSLIPEINDDVIIFPNNWDDSEEIYN